MKRSSYLYVLLIVVISLGTFCLPAYAAKDIVVGFIDAYSGPASVYSNDVADAFQLQVDKVNAAGGLFGRQFKVLKRDSKFKVDISLGHVKQYIMRENVENMKKYLRICMNFLRQIKSISASIQY